MAKFTRVRPNQDIDVRDKVKEDWLVSNAEYFYGLYNGDYCTISRSTHDWFAVLDSYMNGRQDTAQYKPQLNITSDSEGYANINWNDVYSPMPKTVKKLQGMFLSEDHSIVAKAVSEQARSDKLRNSYKKYYKNKYEPRAKAMRQITGVQESVVGAEEDGFIPQSDNEADMISKFVSEKLSYELASEKLIEYTIKLSNYSHNKTKSIYDLIKSNMIINREYIDDYTGKIRWEWVDVNEFMGEFHETTESMSWGGQIKYYTVSDIRKLRPDISEEEIQKIAQTHFERNANGLRFDHYNKYYSDLKSYGYDEFSIPVLEAAWKSTDSEYKKKVKIPSGDYRLYDADFGKKGKNIQVETTETIYEVSWIIGTKYMVSGGRMTDIPRDSSGLVRLPYHVIRLSGKSICENAKPILDQMAILWYKLQNAWAKAVPDSYSFDFAALEDIAEASGGKLHPFDIIDMFYQGKGMPFRSQPIDDEDPNYSRSAPVQRIQGGIGTFLNEYAETGMTLKQDLAEITGISPFEAPKQPGTATEARLAVASMSDVLKPLYNAYIIIKEELAFNTVIRAQILFKFNEKAKKFYEEALGREHVRSLAAAFVDDPMEIGVYFEAMPTDEQKQAVMQAAQAALNINRDGKSILKISEYLFIVERINTQSGLKDARVLLAMRETQDEKRRFAEQQAAMEAQSEMQARQQQAKVQSEIGKMQAEKQLDMTENAQESKLNVDEYREKAKIDMGKTVTEKGIDYGLGQQQNT